MFGIRRFLPLVLAGTVLATEPAVESMPQQDLRVAYEELTENPAQYLGQEVRFAFSVASTVSRWNPFLTRFGTQQWDCVRGWSDASFPWRAEDYARPSVRLFFRKGTRNARRATSAQMYYRFEIEGIVREFLAGEPWIEVTSIRQLDSRLTEGTVIHAERALREIVSEQYVLALENLERARVGKIPDESARELDRLIVECRAALAAKGDDPESLEDRIRSDPNRKPLVPSPDRP